ncbi:MAG: hypothetical protein IVW36_10370 [Dehalococcoidia bacterium]|nr:hypothetical protein [Dehalococcoidia bacterium]
MIQRGKARPVSLLTAVVFGGVLAALIGIALFPIFPRQLNIHVGDVAARTLRSPRTVTFDSTILTNQRRDEAANAVPPALVFNPGPRTTQVQAYDRLAAQVTQIRAEATDPARKRAQLQ